MSTSFNHDTTPVPIDADQVFAASRSALCILEGSDYRWQKVNSAYQALFFPGIDLIGRTVREVMPPAQAQRFCDLLDQVYATGQSQVDHNQLLMRADQARFYLDFSYSPIHDERNAVKAIFVEVHDVTEHLRTREALRASEARYRTLFENFPNGSVFLFDRDLRYVVASGHTLQASGLNTHQFKGKTLAEIFPPDMAARAATVSGGGEHHPRQLPRCGSNLPNSGTAYGSLSRGPVQHFRCRAERID